MESKEFVTKIHVSSNIKNEIILEKHLQEVKSFIEDVGIDKDSDFSKEFLKQTRTVITQFYEMEKLKDEITKLKIKVAEISATTTINQH